MDYDELMTTSTTTDLPMADVETTTELAQTTARVLGLYDIFIPLLGAFIIVFNLAVVVSSGLILKKGKCAAFPQALSSAYKYLNP